MKTTIIGGVLFLAPLGVLAVILSKVFEISLVVAAPLDNILIGDTALGIATVNIVALVLIVFFCYLAGLIATKSFFSARLQRLDGFMTDLVPPYAVFKTVVSSAGGGENQIAMMTPVLVRFDDYEQIAFEIEKTERRAVVFLPGAPSAWSGSAIVVDAERISYPNIPMHEAVRLLRKFGRGTLEARMRTVADQSTGHAASQSG